MESSIFGYEFLSLHVASELIISLGCKLLMFGIPILGHADLFCGNEAVYKNTAYAESILKKKHN